MPLAVVPEASRSRLLRIEPVGVREIVQFQEAVSERPPELSELLLPVSNRAGQSCASGIDRERTIEQPAGAQTPPQVGPDSKVVSVRWEMHTARRRQCAAGGKIRTKDRSAGLAPGAGPKWKRRGSALSSRSGEKEQSTLCRNIVLDFDAADGAREGRQPSHGRFERRDRFGAFSQPSPPKTEHRSLSPFGRRGSFDPLLCRCLSARPLARKPPTVRKAMKPLAMPTLSDSTWTLLKPRPNLPGKIVSGSLLGEVHQEHIEQVAVMTERRPSSASRPR